ncbi:heme NO-binding domain-containing protein [Novosphingobium sp. KCTC 2891]|uniref:heme NO-binding domain-containing protein n=1 Tax=Novosphingobium sp. KCTC 2891 TaxID=2989730 RepID=UPI0022223B31|nr:heme NO-binding domain-containing protein [Novosphingobium sp. KCTC 2891]MCW1384139.1 heme NO-binding domain-containing protein [Novosphingobium sp. KCTC 2891]
MKGVIFNVLEDAVVAEHGPDSWADLLDAAGLDGIYSSLGSYPDAELLAIVDRAAATLDQPVPQVLRWFGRKAIPLLAERYPRLFEQHRSARSFVTSVNDIIHPEVRKLYAGAACPHFHFHELDDGRLAMAYRSQRQLCHLAQGFVEGSGDHFAETVAVEHISCVHHGEPVCRLALDWAA